MWSVAKVEVRSKVLDFTSSGGGRRKTTALLADGVELVNALDLADFDEPAQVIVCEDCGTVGCHSGGWVLFRRIGDGLAVIPAFAHMAEDARSATELRPPSFMNTKGIPHFGAEALEGLGRAIPSHARLDGIPHLTAREAARLIQWEAPCAILGDFPAAPALQPGLVAAVNPGDDQEVVTALGDLIGAAFASDRPIALAQGEPITLYIDRPGLPEWKPLAKGAGSYMLSLGAGFAFSILSR